MLPRKRRRMSPQFVSDIYVILKHLDVSKCVCSFDWILYHHQKQRSKQIKMSNDANFTLTLDGNLVKIIIGKKQTMIPVRSIVKIEVERMKCNSTFIKIHTTKGR